MPPQDKNIFNNISGVINFYDSQGAYQDRWVRYSKSIIKPAVNGGNPYEDMRDVLRRVGITANAQSDYDKAFGIMLKTPTRSPVEIAGGVHALIANGEAGTTRKVYLNRIVDSRMLALVQGAVGDISGGEGGCNMWFIDLPYDSVSTVHIVLAGNESVSAALFGSSS